MRGAGGGGTMRGGGTGAAARFARGPRAPRTSAAQMLSAQRSAAARANGAARTGRMAYRGPGRPLPQGRALSIAPSSRNWGVCNNFISFQDTSQRRRRT